MVPNVNKAVVEESTCAVAVGEEPSATDHTHWALCDGLVVCMFPSPATPFLVLVQPS